MNIGHIKELIAGLPDDTEIIVWVEDRHGYLKPKIDKFFVDRRVTSATVNIGVSIDRRQPCPDL